MPSRKRGVKKRSYKKSRKFKISWPKISRQKNVWFLPTLLILTAFVGIFVLTWQSNTKIPLSVTSAKLVRLFGEARPYPIGERIAFWSESLHREPSLLSPLGPGPDINDTSPLFPQGYDCTTYVETVGALAQSKSLGELANQLAKIRYRNGKVSYENRNHFPEADWIPNNQSAGILKDITLETAKKSGIIAAFAHKEIHKTAWFKGQTNAHAKRAIASLPASISIQLPYISMDRMMEVIQHVPQGAIINVVRQNRHNKPVLITHQGLLVWKKGIPYIRHASRFQEITQNRFTAYINYLQTLPWKVVGFNINVFNN